MSHYRAPKREYAGRCQAVADMVLQAIARGADPAGPLVYLSKLHGVEQVDVYDILRDLEAKGD